LQWCNLVTIDLCQQYTLHKPAIRTKVSEYAKVKTAYLETYNSFRVNLPSRRLTPVQTCYTQQKAKITKTVAYIKLISVCQKRTKKEKETLWSQSASKLYRPSDHRLSAKLAPTFCTQRLSYVKNKELNSVYSIFIDSHYVYKVLNECTSIMNNEFKKCERQWSKAKFTAPGQNFTGQEENPVM
jgi:hypothetical protein